MIPVKNFTAVLLLFFLFAAPNTAENKTPMIQSGNQSCPITYPNDHSLLFENCNPQFNSENYYSIGLTQLSYIYLAFSFVYLVFLMVWFSICLKIRQPFRRIHFLMSGLIVMKGISLICAAEERYYEKITGSRSLPDLLIFIQQCIGAVRLLIVITLIGKGLPLVKPCLKLVDELVFRIIIPLRILAELVSILIIREINGDAKNCSIWRQMIVMVDGAAPFYMMIPYTCSLLSTLGLGPRVSSRLELVRTFNIIVAIYLMATTTFILVRMNGNFKLNAIDDYEYLLKSNVAVEVNSLVFYVVMFNLFRKYFNGIEQAAD